MSKTNKYIGKELDWLEKQVQSLQEYIDSNPISELKDRTIMLASGDKKVEKVTASIEQQITSIRTTIKEMPEILSALENLREKDEKKNILIRGKGSVPAMMRD